MADPLDQYGRPGPGGYTEPTSEFATPEDLRRARISAALGWDVGHPWRHMAQELVTYLPLGLRPMTPGMMLPLPPRAPPPTMRLNPETWRYEPSGSAQPAPTPGQRALYELRPGDNPQEALGASMNPFGRALAEPNLALRYQAADDAFSTQNEPISRPPSRMSSLAAGLDSIRQRATELWLRTRDPDARALMRQSVTPQQRRALYEMPPYALEDALMAPPEPFFYDPTRTRAFHDAIRDFESRNEPISRPTSSAPPPIGPTQAQRDFYEMPVAGQLDRPRMRFGDPRLPATARVLRAAGELERMEPPPPDKMHADGGSVSGSDWANRVVAPRVTPNIHDPIAVQVPPAGRSAILDRIESYEQPFVVQPWADERNRQFRNWQTRMPVHADGGLVGLSRPGGATVLAQYLTPGMLAMPAPPATPYRFQLPEEQMPPPPQAPTAGKPGTTTGKVGRPAPPNRTR